MNRPTTTNSHVPTCRCIWCASEPGSERDDTCLHGFTHGWTIHGELQDDEIATTTPPHAMKGLEL